MKFDASGKLVKSFGAGLLIFPHGIFVDRDGNVWVTDGQDDAPRAQGTAANTLFGPPPGATKGNQVFKFSPDGKLLMTLGTRGGAARPASSTSRMMCSSRPTATSSSPKGTAARTRAS